MDRLPITGSVRPYQNYKQTNMIGNIDVENANISNKEKVK